MRINGRWFESDERLPQPVIEAKLEAANGEWLECPFLIDTGADSTVLSAKVLRLLGRPATPAQKQLGGVGGAVETWEVWTTLCLTADNGTVANIAGCYAAFQADAALEICVLGYDVLHLFAVVVDRPGDTVCLIRAPHSYTIRS